jgi:hypothetical protein
MRPRWLFASAALLLACSEDARDRDDTTSTGGGPGAGGAGGTAGGGSGGTAASGGGGSGGSGGDGEGGEGGGPHPPPTAVRCGHGVFDAADAAAACASQTIGPPGDEIEAHCEAVTMASGAWEAWCSEAGAYLWARFDDVVATGAYESCAGAPGLLTNLGWYTAAALGGGSAGDLILGTSYDVDTSPPTDVELELTLDDADYAEEGTATLWLTPSLHITCPGGTLGPQVAVLAAPLSWPTDPP